MAIKTQVAEPAAPTTTTDVLKSGYQKISSIILTILFITLPLFIIPFTNISFFYAKFGLTIATVLVSLILLVVLIINERKVTRPSWMYIGASVVLPLMYFISALFSNDIVGSLIGLGVDLDTFFFILLGSLIMILVTKIFNQKQSVFFLNLGFLVVATLVSIFHLLRYYFGPEFLSFGLFTTVTANTIGSFSDLGVYAGLTLIISLLSLEFLPVKGLFRIGFYVALVVSTLMAAISNFFVVNGIFGTSISISLSFILAIIALIIFVHKKVTSPKNAFPVITLLVFLVMLTCTIQAKQVAELVVKTIGIGQQEILDVRISPDATFDLTAKTLSENIRSTVVGVGPNNFYQAWGRHKETTYPNTVNISNFWNTDFNLGFGYIPTAFVTSGLLGILGWAFFLISLLYYIYKLFKSILLGTKDPAVIYSALTTSIASLYLWIMALLYTPGPVILIFAFFFTGLFGSILFKEGIVAVKDISWDEAGYWKSFAIVFSLVILLAAFVSTGYAWTTRLIASMNAQKSIVTLQINGQAVPESQALLAEAISWNSSDTYLRFYSEVSLIRPTQLISQSRGVVKQDSITEEVAGDINKALAAANEAALGGGLSDDYRNWIQLGKVYEAATFLGATTTASLAVESYARAELLNPTHPTPPYLLGRLFMYGQNYEVARQKLQRSATLRPNFKEAVDLYNSLPSSNNVTSKPSVEKTPSTSSSTPTSTPSNTPSSTSQKTPTSTSTKGQ